MARSRPVLPGFVYGAVSSYARHGESDHIPPPEVQVLFTTGDLVGCRMRDTDGAVVGRVTALYRYPAELADPPGAAAVTWGHVIRSTRLVDLLDAELDEEEVIVVYPLAVIRSAPNYQALMGDTLSNGHAAAVLLHYRGSLAPV